MSEVRGVRGQGPGAKDQGRGKREESAYLGAFRFANVFEGHEAEGYIAKDFNPSSQSRALAGSANCIFQCGIDIRRVAVVIFVLAYALSLSARSARAESATRLVTLTDGVRLVFRHETEGDTLAITLFVREEAAASPSEEAVRRMVNASLFYGSVHLSYDAAGALAGKIGNISTRQTPDCVAITCVTTPARYRDAIYLLCEVIKNAEFSPEALDRARTTVLRLREERNLDPFLAAYDVVARSLQMRYEPDGVQLRHVTQDQAIAYFNTHFVPQRTVFSAAGNIDPTAFQKSLDNNLFDYSRPGAADAPIAPGAIRDPEHRKTQTSDAAGSVSYALVAVNTPFIGDPDYPAFCVLATLLGGGNASRMFREIRDEAGIGYSVGTALRPEDGDPMVAFVEWDAAKSISPAMVLKRIQDQLDALISPTASVIDTEIERARNFAAGQYILRHERIQERCFLPGWYEMMGAGYAFDDDLPARLSNVAKDDVLRVARKYLPIRAATLRIGSK